MYVCYVTFHYQVSSLTLLYKEAPKNISGGTPVRLGAAHQRFLLLPLP